MRYVSLCVKITSRITLENACFNWGSTPTLGSYLSYQSDSYDVKFMPKSRSLQNKVFSGVLLCHLMLVCTGYTTRCDAYIYILYRSTLHFVCTQNRFWRCWVFVWNLSKKLSRNLPILGAYIEELP